MLALEPVMHCLSAGRILEHLGNGHAALLDFAHRPDSVFHAFFPPGHRQRGFLDGAFPWGINPFGPHLCQRNQQRQPEIEGLCRHTCGHFVVLGDSIGQVPNLALRASSRRNVGHDVTAMFVIMVAVFLLSWFIAQLNSDYQTDYEDIVDHARLNSARIIVTTMEQA